MSIKLRIKVLSLAAVSVASLLLLSQATTAASSRTCAYDVNSGIPNPLGMRAYITLTEEQGDTQVLFEQFPSPIGGDQVRATIASSRVLVFYGMKIDQVRTLMLQDPAYYTELVGYEDPEGFAPVNAVLACE
ncbi:MAG TPA: hypothetical protein V6C84_20675 [Coleofasciculaceae cyanobacterium]|jgi:hypothetical protein